MKPRHPVYKTLQFGAKTVYFYPELDVEGNNIEIVEGDKVLWDLSKLFHDDAVTLVNKVDDHVLSFTTWNGAKVIFDVDELHEKEIILQR